MPWPLVPRQGLIRDAQICHNGSTPADKTYQFGNHSSSMHPLNSPANFLHNASQIVPIIRLPVLAHLFPSTAIIATIASVPYLPPHCVRQLPPLPDLDPILITTAHADNGLVLNCISLSFKYQHKSEQQTRITDPEWDPPCG